MARVVIEWDYFKHSTALRLHKQAKLVLVPFI
ncbi:hypothetical protein DJ91_5718 [Priestia megaterium]|jgi:hypothetical protein|nr:hypothetical protein DJ91_5718 [Priestia megaterium]